MNYLKSFIVLVFVLYFISYNPISVFAQSSGQTMGTGSSALGSNLTTLNANDLSDGQVRKLIAQADAAGMSDNQLISSLETNGLAIDQGNILLSRINSIRKGGGSAFSTGNTASADTSSRQKQRKLNYTPDTSSNPKQQDLGNSLLPKIFGSDLFRGNTNSSFEPNLKLATPVNYILGPDDQLNVAVYGNSVANWSLNVSPEGNINIPGSGIVNVGGKTIEQATATIKSKLTANNYNFGNGTSLSVTLGNIRSIKVILVGQVFKPGTYTLPSLATAFNALYAAGGPNDNGTFRQIEIIRNNKIFRTLDIYDFLLKGQQKDNIALQDQDIIRVPTYRTHVVMAGEVKTPAIFEVLPGETLSDVLKFAGGFTDEAYTARIKVLQIGNQQRRITDVAEGDYKNYIPLSGDKYIVDRILERYENRVTINGSVFRPGEYELSKGLTLSQLIEEASGLKEDAFNGRGSITRLNPDNTTEFLSFDVKGIVNKTMPDITLQREDVVSISSIFDLRDKYIVSIKGEVRNPGDFAYSDSISVADLIVKAGGFTESASTKRIEIARRVTNSDPTSKAGEISQVYYVDVDRQLKTDGSNFVLKPYDIVSIYSLPGYETQSNVKVEGEVLYPGFYTIKRKNEKISDIISRAGGLTASADADGGTLKRNNIFGADKSKVDTAEIAQERKDRITRLKNTYSDSTSIKNVVQLHNDFVGINLKQILEKPGSNGDLILEDGDVIRVPKQQQIVRVNGEVLYPSAVVYSKGTTLRGYVLDAGGFSPYADKGHSYVVYQNGSVKGSKKFLFFRSHPKIKPGSEIFVPKKVASRPISVQETVGIASALTSLIFIVYEIAHNN